MDDQHLVYGGWELCSRLKERGGIRDTYFAGLERKRSRSIRFIDGQKSAEMEGRRRQKQANDVCITVMWC